MSKRKQPFSYGVPTGPMTMALITSGRFCNLKNGHNAFLAPDPKRASGKGTARELPYLIRAHKNTAVKMEGKPRLKGGNFLRDTAHPTRRRQQGRWVRNGGEVDGWLGTTVGVVRRLAAQRWLEWQTCASEDQCASSET